MINPKDKKDYLKEHFEFLEKYPKEVWCKVFELEEDFKKYFWVDFASACSSWSTALLLALKSICVWVWDEVLLNCNYFISDPNSILLAWAKPIFLDLWKNINSLSIENIKNKITKKTKAIIIIHMYWYPIENTLEIINFAREKNIYVIEDCCQSIWAKIWEKYIWTFWDLWIFSFDSNKFVKWWEWWMIISNNEKLINKTRYYKNNCKNENEFKELWYNFRYNDFSAIYAKYSLKNLEESIEIRRKMKEKNEKKFEIYKPEWNIKPTYYNFIIKGKNNIFKNKHDYLNIKIDDFPNYKKLYTEYEIFSLPNNIYDDLNQEFSYE